MRLVFFFELVTTDRLMTGQKLMTDNYYWTLGTVIDHVGPILESQVVNSAAHFMKTKLVSKLNVKPNNVFSLHFP